MKKIIYIILPVILGIGYSGCSSSYLDEESYGATVAMFDTQEGSEALLNQIYTKMNNLYGGFTYSRFTENGTDIWMRGQNNGATGLTDYKSLDAYEGNVSWLWNHCYKALWNTNLFFETIDDVPYTSEELKQRRKAEMLVLQSYFLWVVTETWGDTYLPKTTDKEEGLEARRSTREDFYQKIISNLETAINMMSPERTTEYGRIDQSVAKAFLARIYLFHEEWDKAIEMSSSVIDDYGYELCPSWTDMWDAAKRNKEFIWTSEFSSDEAFGGGSSIYWQTYAMFIDRFAGIKTELHWTGYGGCQILPSKYYLSLFDRDADLRWKEGHQWVWYYNDPSDDTSAFPYMTRVYQDTALYLSVDVLTPQQREYMRPRYTFFDINDMYDEMGSPKDRFTFIGMTKFDDHTRPNAMSGLSSRNYPILRLGEMYLIRAEANIRKSSPDRAAAAKDINELRERIIAPGHETAMTVSADEMTMDFILEERARELAGEQQRWYDLKRTGTLVSRVTIYNPDAAPNIKNYHQVRPIPQTQFDGMPDPTTLGQNPEY